MERGCPYLYTGSKFRVIWPSVLIIQGGLQQPPLGKYVWEKPSGDQGLLSLSLLLLLRNRHFSKHIKLILARIFGQILKKILLNSCTLIFILAFYFTKIGHLVPILWSNEVAKRQQCPKRDFECVNVSFQELSNYCCLIYIQSFEYLFSEPTLVRVSKLYLRKKLAVIVVEFVLKNLNIK